MLDRSNKGWSLYRPRGPSLSLHVSSQLGGFSRGDFIFHWKGTVNRVESDVTVKVCERVLFLSAFEARNSKRVGFCCRFGVEVRTG
jgi:hypothetical protein